MLSRKRFPSRLAAILTAILLPIPLVHGQERGEPENSLSIGAFHEWDNIFTHPENSRIAGVEASYERVVDNIAFGINGAFGLYIPDAVVAVHTSIHYGFKLIIGKVSLTPLAELGLHLSNSGCGLVPGLGLKAEYRINRRLATEVTGRYRYSSDSMTVKNAHIRSYYTGLTMKIYL